MDPVLAKSFSILLFKSEPFMLAQIFSAFGTELSFAMIGLGIVLLLAVPYAIREVFTIASGNHPQGYNKNHHKWRPYQVIYKGFNDNIYSNQIFYLIYALRLCLPMFIAAWFYFSPIFQAFLYNVISIAALIYIWITQPIIRRINQIQLILLESLMLIINICLLLLTILNASGKSLNSLGASLGDLIVFTNTCINLLLLVFLIIKIILGIKAVIHFNHNSDNKSRQDLNPWPQVFVFILQQGGMGFEEIDFEEFVAATEDDYRNGLLVTDKGIKAKGRSWDSVRRNTKRIIPDSTNTAILRRNTRISQLFKVSEEFDMPENSADRRAAEKWNEQQMISDASPGLRGSLIVPNQKKRPGSQSTVNPFDEEKDNLEDQSQNNQNESQRPSRSLRRPNFKSGTFLIDLAERGAFAEHNAAYNATTEKEKEEQNDEKEDEQKEKEKEHEDEKEDNGDVPVFIDPDLMKGVTMADLKKTDLRS